MSVVAHVENLGVRFWVERRQMTLVRDIILHPFRQRHIGQELWALRHVSFQLERGKVLGVIGNNGAGKTTLLMAMARIYAPDEGWVQIKGRVTSLLEVGAGFRWDLTGRENVMLYGAIMGIARSTMKTLFDTIVEFAGVGDFIDTPMRTYSAGMRMRLGFAVAMSAEPDVLLVDEALSIGDSAFQRRALERIEQFRNQGGTLVYVSHDMTKVGDLCDECLLLDRGRLISLGHPLSVIATYWERVWGKRVGDGIDPRLAGSCQLIESARRWGSGEIRIVGFSILDNTGKKTQVIEQGAAFVVEIAFSAEAPYEDYVVQVSLFQGKKTIAIMKSDPLASPKVDRNLQARAILRVDSRMLAIGTYEVDAEIRNEAFSKMYDHLDKFTTITVVKGSPGCTEANQVHLPCQWTFSVRASGNNG